MQQAARERNFSRLIGQIDGELGKPGTDGGDKAQLHCNRGLCHQRLNLNRKALKVPGAELVRRCHDACCLEAKQLDHAGL